MAELSNNPIKRATGAFAFAARIADAEAHHAYRGTGSEPVLVEDLLLLAHEIEAERKRLDDLVNNAHTADFLEAVRLEAAHQVERHGVEHDAGKEPSDWFWLLGYLGGKALRAAQSDDKEKALHHTISSAAMLLNWHGHIQRGGGLMRPGIEPPAGESNA